MTKTTTGRTSTNAELHPYLKYNFRGSDEVREAQEALSNNIPSTVSTLCDFRKDKSPGINTCMFGPHNTKYATSTHS